MGTTCSMPVEGRTALGTCRSADKEGARGEGGKVGKGKGWRTSCQLLPFSQNEPSSRPAWPSSMPPSRPVPQRNPPAQGRGGESKSRRCEGVRRTTLIQERSRKLQAHLCVCVTELDRNVALELILEPDGENARDGLDDRRFSVGDVTDRTFVRRKGRGRRVSCADKD